MPAGFFEETTESYPDACPEENEAFRFVRNWHRTPELHDAIWYKGLNLGELNEYVLFSAVLKALLRRSGKMPQ